MKTMVEKRCKRCGRELEPNDKYEICSCCELLIQGYGDGESGWG